MNRNEQGQTQKRDLATEYGLWILNCLPSFLTSLIGLLGELAIGVLFGVIANLLQGKSSSSVNMFVPLGVGLGTSLVVCFEVKEYEVSSHILWAVFGSYVGIGAGAHGNDIDSVLMQCAIFASFSLVWCKPKLRSAVRLAMLFFLFCLAIKVALINSTSLRMRTWRDRMSIYGSLLDICFRPLLLLVFRISVQLLFSNTVMGIANRNVLEERFQREISSILQSLALCLSGINNQPFYMNMMLSLAGAFAGIWSVDGLIEKPDGQIHGAFSSSLVMALFECWSTRSTQGFRKVATLFWWAFLYVCLWKVTLILNMNENANDSYYQEFRRWREERRERQRRQSNKSQHQNGNNDSQDKEDFNQSGTRQRKMEYTREDALQVLGLGSDATPDQIKMARNKLYLQWHPDKNPENIEEATRKTQAVQKAFAFLTESE